MRVITNRPLKTALNITIPLVLIPAVVIFGSLYLQGEKYALTSLIITLLSLVLFVCGFESSKTGTRRLVIVSVMVALGVVGRFIPLFKPITALTVITAITLGPQAGFLTGALTALISNISFGQGPWTPFQMFAWGILGLIAGFLAKPLNKSKPLLLIYLLFSGIAYSMIMDVWTVLWYNQGFNLQMYLAAIVSAIPHTVMYSVSNIIFALLLAKPFCEKLNRVKIKYDI
jgi:energy-coupling factor transport system substrate-specific component